MQLYLVKSAYHNPPLFAIERAAASKKNSFDILIDHKNCLGAFGIRKYGSHLNGYVIDDDGTWKMWMGKRSSTKQTFPGMYDNLVRKILFIIKSKHANSFLFCF